jgi:predicted DNA-binding helix-hairpin-helix protein
MLEIRRFKALTLEDVRRLSRGIEKLKPFIVTADWSPGELTDKADLQARVAQPPQQMALF